MFAYKTGIFFPFLVELPVLDICTSILEESIFMYFDITCAISFFISSIISGEQFTLSDISKIFSLSLAISLDVFLLNIENKLMPAPPVNSF